MDDSNEISLSTKKLREKIRAHCKTVRCDRRNNEIDSIRFRLGDIQKMITEFENLTETDVKKLSSKIKRKKHATKDDLYQFSCAFLQSNENIAAFIKNQGSLQVIVKELTSSNIEQQIRACETLCNLSLGDSLICEKITLAAGSYIVTYLSSTELRLKQTSLWVILNILASGDKGMKNLISMKIFEKLFLLFVNKNEDENLIRDSAIGLDLILSSGCETPNFLYENMELMPSEHPCSELYLKLIFKYVLIESNNTLNDKQLEFLTNLCIANINNNLILNTPIYSIRMLANLMKIYGEKVLNILENSKDYPEIFNKIFNLNNIILNKECFWLIKIIIFVQNSIEKTETLFNSLKIKRTNLLW